MAKTKSRLFGEFIIIFILLHIVRIMVKQLLYSAFGITFFVDSMGTAVSFLIFIPIVFIYAKHRETRIPLMPERFSAAYVLISITVLAFMASSILISRDYSLQNISILIYSTVITPVFEELLFRGYIWEKMSSEFKSKATVLVITAVLFGIWHTGYVDTLYLRMPHGNIVFSVMMKVLVGLIYGVAIGLVRMKMGNCYAAILLHSAMNVFGS